jgi:hypothetical protein
MNEPTYNDEPRPAVRSAVPLQDPTPCWEAEPGYGGSQAAWEAFDAWMDVQLAYLEAGRLNCASMSV